MKDPKCKCHGLSRRELLATLGLWGVASPFVGGLSPLLPWLSPDAMAQGATPHRFLQIFLGGGWDSILATDPAVAGGAKARGGMYQPAYYQSGNSQFPGAPITVSGKSNLVVGPGLAPAASAFAAVPTAFVNGIYVEVTAHELATNYLYSGQPSLSRSREYPAIVATMADQTGGFPAHVILGGPIPLSTTKANNPPLQSLDTETFVKMLAGPYSSDGSGFHDATYTAAHNLIASMNQEYKKRLGKAADSGLSAWTSSEAGLPALYAKRYDQKLGPTSQMRTDFEAPVGKSDAVGAKMALAYQVLKEGVSRFCTVNFDGFDTHQNHFSSHLPLMQGFARSLKALLDYMAATNDPDTASKKLIETTTILITSEFNRTPLFNGANGTDHWQTAAAVVLGRGVKDNTVVGSTDTAGNAVNYGSGKLLPDHLAATALRALGFAAEADKISGVNLTALFT